MIIRHLVQILEKPHTEKPYKELIKYYKNKGMSNEASAFELLMEHKFANNTPVDKKQREDH
jgi:hypothetical protein